MVLGDVYFFILQCSPDEYQNALTLKKKYENDSSEYGYSKLFHLLCLMLYAVV